MSSRDYHATEIIGRLAAPPETYYTQSSGTDLPGTICNHPFSGTGIIVFLQNGGAFEAAQAMATLSEA